MAPDCILLERNVSFRDHPLDTEPLDIGERAKRVVGAERAKDLIGPDAAESRLLLSREATEASIARYLLSMKPDLEVVDPPEISCLTMQRPRSSDPIPDYGWYLPQGAVAAAADKNLVVLYANTYRPALSYNRGYLLLDLDADASSSSSLSTIPGISLEYAVSFESVGYGAVIMTREGGAFVLAELFFTHHRRGSPGLGMLCLWQSSLGSWVYKRGPLPTEVLPPWTVHMSFPVQSRNRNLFCWVNLLHGLTAIWDPIARSTRWTSTKWCLLFRCPMAAPSAMETAGGRRTRKNSATLPALTAPLSFSPWMVSWKLDTKLRLKDLWTDMTFICKDVPLFPILSMLEREVVYLVIPGHVEDVEGCRFMGVKLLLCVDTCKARIISATHPKQPIPLVRWRHLLAFSTSHSQRGSKYHQGAPEAIRMGPSGKRMKLQ